MMPSNSAMDLVNKYIKEPHPSWNDQQLWLAKAIDAHTAEALAEHVRVMDMAEKALEDANALNQNWVAVAELDMLLHLSEYKSTIEQGKQALAAITKLKGAK